MNMQPSDKAAQEQNKHVLHMWQPLHFQVPENYNYLRTGFFSPAATRLLRTIAGPLLFVYLRLCVGFRTHGKENVKLVQQQGVVTICNHVHPLDCVMVDLAMRKRRMYYVTLESNYRIPLVRHLIRILGGLPLSASRQRTRELFCAMGQALKEGSAVQIYPEGVLIPYDSTLRPFKKGAFHLAVKNNVPILPMVICRHESRGLFRLYKKKPCLHLHILLPVYPEPGLSTHEAIERMRRRCLQSMNQALSQ